MKSWVAPVILLSLAGVGFAVVKIVTSKSSTTVGGIDYRASVYQGDDGYFAQVFVSGKPTGPLIGPLPNEDAAADQAVAYLKGLDTPAFYTIHEVPPAPGQEPEWFFEGWSRGELVMPMEGPYASEAAAMAAGSNWAAAAMGSA